jgi:hypothetical protein
MTISNITIRALAIAAGAGALLLAGAASAQDAQPESTGARTKDKAAEIATQPARDLGVSKTEIPPVLVRATEDPYSLDGVKTCAQIVAATRELNEVLGPDYSVGATARQENRAARFAEAGGAAVVNSLIPFRGLVREVSGAAPAERNLNAAISAGYARRGFLRGLYQKQGCRGL